MAARKPAAKRGPRRSSAARKASSARASAANAYLAHTAEYIAPTAPAIVTVKKATYLTIDGTGAPDSDGFTEAVGALYGVAWTTRMARKFAGTDYGIGALEGLWWTDERGDNFVELPREKWHWKLMIRIPEFVTRSEVRAAQRRLVDQGKSELVKQVQRETLEEGRCVQMMHVGPYAEEPRSIAEMQHAAEEAGVHFTGRHHEIYLNDPRRVPPERLRTILRHPVS